jgi:low affinity Fe/Cu permease
MPSLTEGFDRLAHWTARHAGRASTFALALAIIVVWAVTGPLFNWSDPGSSSSTPAPRSSLS